MSYINLYDKDTLEAVSLGRSINDFNMELGDYVRVDIEDDNKRVLGSLYSNRILLEKADTPGLLWFKEYHYHPENPQLGYCAGKLHNTQMLNGDKLNPISINGKVVTKLNINDQYKKQVDIYKDDTGHIYIKPKQLLEKISGGISMTKRGKYKLKVHFFRDVKSELGIFLNNMKFNLIENGNFFAGLEATQTGDIDRSSGKNNILMMSNPGFSKFVLNQNGLPGNKYSMRVTGITPNTNYVFSCWAAWDSNYTGGKHLGKFDGATLIGQSGEQYGLQPVSNTTPIGSFYNDEGNRNVNTKTINDLTWVKVYKFVATDGTADSGILNIHLGESEGSYYPTTSPLSNRYFTDLRLEKIQSYEGEILQSYLNKLYNDSAVVYLLKKDSLVSENRQIRNDNPTALNDASSASEKLSFDVENESYNQVISDLDIDLSSFFKNTLPQIFDNSESQLEENQQTEAPSGGNMMYKKGGNTKPKFKRRRR